MTNKKKPVEIKPLSPKQLRQAKGLHTISETAKKLDVSLGFFRAVIERGGIPQPATQWMNSTRLYYTPEDVEEIKSTIRNQEAE